MEKCQPYNNRIFAVQRMHIALAGSYPFQLT